VSGTSRQASAVEAQRFTIIEEFRAYSCSPALHRTQCGASVVYASGSAQREDYKKTATEESVAEIFYFVLIME
jgi:hypothetical protein